MAGPDNLDHPPCPHTHDDTTSHFWVTFLDLQASFTLQSLCCARPHRFKAPTHSLEYNPGPSSLEVVLFVHGPVPAFTHNDARTTSHGSTFAFILEGKPRPYSRP